MDIVPKKLAASLLVQQYVKMVHSRLADTMYAWQNPHLAALCLGITIITIMIDIVPKKRDSSDVIPPSSCTQQLHSLLCRVLQWLRSMNIYVSMSGTCYSLAASLPVQL